MKAWNAEIVESQILILHASIEWLQGLVHFLYCCVLWTTFSWFI